MIFDPGCPKAKAAFMMKAAVKAGLVDVPDVDKYEDLLRQDLIMRGMVVGIHMGTGSVLTLCREIGLRRRGETDDHKNVRCWNLTVSFRDMQSNGERLPFNRDTGFEWAHIFYQPLDAFVWQQDKCDEDPKISIYRLFCDEQWRPLGPRQGPLAERELLNKGWRHLTMPEKVGHA